jgi:hypothetical protein
MAIVTTIVLGILIKLAADELKLWFPAIAQSFLRFAVNRLPEDERARRQEEWAADLLAFPDGAIKCIRALDLLRASIWIRCSYSKTRIEDWMNSLMPRLRGKCLHWCVLRYHNVILRLRADLDAYRRERELPEKGKLTADAAHQFLSRVSRMEVLKIRALSVALRIIVWPLIKT